MIRLKNFISSVEYFKTKNIDDKTLNLIVASAGFSYCNRGRWVFKEGDSGDKMYILLHGHCKTIIQNKNFLEARRALRDEMLVLYDLVEKSISYENKISKYAVS